MKNVQYIIDQVRKQTENEEVTDFTGIQDSEFIQYINDAQHSLQAAITSQHPRVFVKEKVLPIVSGQEKYDLPEDCYLKNKVFNVEYSPTDKEEDYYTLEEETIKSRVPGTEGSPVKYSRLAGQILLIPQATKGNLRINYVKRVREVDLRRAKVASSATPSSSSTWSVALDNSTFLTDTESLQEHEEVCIVDKKGNIIAKDLPLNAVSSALLTIDAHTSDSEDTAIQAGHFVVGGANTSTHGEFDDSVERYIVAYCAWKILKRDSSVDSQEAQAELSIMLNDIVKSYAMISDDIQFIPQLNTWDDWSL